MKIIKNKSFQQERELYNQEDVSVINCKFAGKADGESPLKESSRVQVKDCLFSLRYSLWHNTDLKINNSKFTELCRAPLWYCKNVKIKDSKIDGVKALRESNDIEINNSKIYSEEFGWRCNNLIFNKSEFKGNYFLFESKDITLNKIKLTGKYSLQYTENVVLNNCELDTKDCLWHAKKVTLNNCIIKGEYFGWYSDHVTLNNCVIEGTQPMCYCKHLVLNNCRCNNCDLAFEYSDVKATIIGNVISIKNPYKGKIVVDSVKEIIKSNTKYRCHCRIKEK